MADDEEPEGRPRPSGRSGRPRFEPSLPKTVMRATNRFFRSRTGFKTIGFMVLTVVMLIGLFVYQHDSYPVGPRSTGGGGPTGLAAYVDMNTTITDSGTAVEQADPDEKTYEIDQENLFMFNVTVKWDDEADQMFKSNQPDTFLVEVTAPDGSMVSGGGSNQRNQEGVIVVTIDRDILASDAELMAWTGTWSVNVTCTDAGDQEPQFFPDIGGQRTNPDTGNAYTLEVEYVFKAPP